MIQLTQDEFNAINLLGLQAQQVQAQLQQIQAAQLATIRLLETKYNATFDPTTGKFNEKVSKQEIKQPK